MVASGDGKVRAIAFQERRVQVMDTIAKPVYYRGGLRGWSGFRAAIRSRGLDGSLWIAIDTLAVLAAFWCYLPLP
jgi:hypothetical protein